MAERPREPRLIDALERTWPPAETLRRDGWILRRGAGGGKRVSAASADDGEDVEAAAAAMRGWGQRPLFRLAGGEAALDERLAALGYAKVDPTVFYVGAPEDIAAAPLRRGVKWVEVAARLALLDEIWEKGGVGPGRRAVMDRAPAPKTVLMSRTDMTVAGVAFAALDRDIAMVHAVEVRPHLRRAGAGAALAVGAAAWARAQGARWLALAVTEANVPARALYEKLGMEAAGRYHYRQAEE